jgi:hypothetical protein
MPRITRNDVSDPDTYAPDLMSAAQEAVGRLKFAERLVLTDAADAFGGWDQCILRDQIEYVTLLLEEAIEKVVLTNDVNGR